MSLVPTSTVNLTNTQLRRPMKKTILLRKPPLEQGLPSSDQLAFNRETYAAQLNGKDGASKIIRNLYIPPTFVQADGKTFGEMVKTQLIPYGDEWKSTKLDDGQNGLFDAKKAKGRVCKSEDCLGSRRCEIPNSHRYACRPNDSIKSSTGAIFQTIS